MSIQLKKGFRRQFLLLLQYLRCQHQLMQVRHTQLLEIRRLAILLRLLFGLTVPNRIKKESTR